MAHGRSDHSFDVTSKRQSSSSARVDKGIKGIARIVVFIGVGLLQSLLMRAQDTMPTIPPEPTILPELSKRTGPEPMKAEATPMPVMEKPSIEISAGTPSEKPAWIVQQVPLRKAETISAPPVEKKPPAAKHTSVQPKATEPIAVSVLTLSALKAVATSAPLPDYPYQAKQARVTGSGVCTLVVDRTNGRVKSATMAQSTGSRILDKVTTDAFRRWRFKPGTVAQVKVPITYE